MDTETTYQQAQALQADGAHGEAAALYKWLITQLADARFFIAYGVCLQSLGHWDESVKQLKAGVALKPRYCEGDARLFLAESLLRAGKKSEAVAEWKIVAAMPAEYPSYEKVPDEARRLLAKHTA